MQIATAMRTNSNGNAYKQQKKCLQTATAMHKNSNNNAYTLSGRIVSHAEVARSIPGSAEPAPIYTVHVVLGG